MREKEEREREGRREDERGRRDELETRSQQTKFTCHGWRRDRGREEEREREDK